MRRLITLVSIAGALAIAGCGSDNKSSATSSATTNSTATTPAAPAKGSDAAKAAAAELQLADFPSGWTQASAAQKNADPNCPGIKDARKLATTRAAAPDFSFGRNARTQSVIYVYKDASTATKAYKGLSSGSVRTCIGRLTLQLVNGAKGIKTGKTSDTRLDIPPAGSARFAFRFAVPVSGNGHKAELDQDIALVRNGRAVSVIAMLQEAPTFDAALRNRLVNAAAKRVAASFPGD